VNAKAQSFSLHHIWDFAPGKQPLHLNYNNLHVNKEEPNMRYLLHAPRHDIVFATNDGSISHFLRRKHHWAGFKTERTTLPEYISTSCIREHEDGTVEIIEQVLDGEQMVEEIKGLLRRDGYTEPDLRFVGRLVRSSGVSATELTAKGYDEGDVTSWEGDGLDGSRVL